MKNFILPLALLLSFNLYAQLNFENGYIIDESDTKVNVLIKNMDWKFNPDKFKYKNLNSNEILTGNLSSVKEFGVGKFRYIRSTVKLDMNSNKLSNLTHLKEPSLEDRTLFLREVVKGKSSLMMYYSGNVKQFFYSLGDKDNELLIYKEFLNSDSDVAQNNHYKQQLWNNMSCNNSLLSRIESLKYEMNSLINYFVSYNECENVDFTNSEINTVGVEFHISPKLAIKNSDLAIDREGSGIKNADFGSKMGVKFGLEAELVMGFNNKKWSIFLEPMFQSFSAETTIETHLVVGGTDVVKADYKSIEIPFGFRHYMFLDGNSKLFISAMYVIDFSLGSKIDYEKLNDVDIDTDNNLAFGIGFKKEKFSTELRYSLNRLLITKESFWSTDYTSIGLYIGYEVF